MVDSEEDLSEQMIDEGIKDDEDEEELEVD